MTPGPQPRTPAFGLFDILQVDASRPTAEVIGEHRGHWQLADDLRLDYIFLAERHFLPMYRAAAPGLLLAHLAATTQHARLGVLAYTLPLHNPVLLAEQISMLDHLTNGRLEVGMGLGHRPIEIDAIGLPSEHRNAIFLESHVLLQELWKGQPLSHDGALYHLRDVLVDPPLQQPHPPLWFAGVDPNIATWAAHSGISLAVGFQPDTALTAPAHAFRTAQDAASSSRLAVMRHIYVADSDDEAREEIISDLLHLDAQLAANPPDGSAPRVPIDRADAERQFSARVAQQTFVAGSPTTVATAIAQTLTTLQADTYLANIHLFGVDEPRLRRTLTKYANEVRPLVREALA